MNTWLLVFIIGTMTFLGRMSFLVFFGQREMPKWALIALQYVPVTALTALATPAIILNDGDVDLSLNPKMIAGLVAVVIAWRTKNLFLTMSGGMLVFWILTGLGL